MYNNFLPKEKRKISAISSIFLSVLLKPASIFQYFEEICSIPHGSGNMDAIATYCCDFAEVRGLRYVRDDVSRRCYNCGKR